MLASNLSKVLGKKCQIYKSEGGVTFGNGEGYPRLLLSKKELCPVLFGEA